MNDDIKVLDDAILKESLNKIGIVISIILIVTNIVSIFNSVFNESYNTIIIIIDVAWTMIILLTLFSFRLFYYLKVKKILKNQNLHFKCTGTRIENDQLINTKFEIEIKIKLCFFKRKWILITAETPKSISYSTQAEIKMENYLWIKYNYYNEPFNKPDVSNTMQEHMGTAILKLHDGKNDFYYFNGEKKRISWLKEMSNE